MKKIKYIMMVVFAIIIIIGIVFINKSPSTTQKSEDDEIEEIEEDSTVDKQTGDEDIVTTEAILSKYGNEDIQDPATYGIYANDYSTLDQLDLMIRQQRINYKTKTSQLVRIINIENDKITYKTIDDIVNDQALSSSLNQVDLYTKEITCLKSFETIDRIDECFLYKGKPLYIHYNTYNGGIETLMYGDEAIITGVNIYTLMDLYHDGNIYFIINQCGTNVRTVYLFDGTLKQLWQSTSGRPGGTDILQNYYKRFVFLDTEDSNEDVYYQRDGILMKHRFKCIYSIDEPYIIGDYAIYDNKILNMNTDVESNVDVIFLHDGTSENKTDYFVKLYNDGNQYDNVRIDLGNNMFLFTDYDSNKLYKAIIDESLHVIVYVDTDYQLALNTVYYNNDRSVYAYYETYSGYGDTNDQDFILYRIDFDYINN